MFDPELASRALGTIREKFRREPDPPTAAEVERSAALDALVETIDAAGRRQLPTGAELRAKIEQMRKDNPPAVGTVDPGPPRVEELQFSEADEVRLTEVAEMLGADPEALRHSLQDHVQLRALRDYYLGDEDIEPPIETLYRRYPVRRVGLPGAQRLLPAAHPATADQPTEEGKGGQ